MSEEKNAVKEESNACTWTATEFQPDYWDTCCGETFIIETGTPEENKMKYCCFCGKPLNWSIEQ